MRARRRVHLSLFSFSRARALSVSLSLSLSLSFSRSLSPSLSLSLSLSFSLLPFFIGHVYAFDKFHFHTHANCPLICENDSSRLPHQDTHTYHTHTHTYMHTQVRQFLPFSPQSKALSPHITHIVARTHILARKLSPCSTLSRMHLKTCV